MNIRPSAAIRQNYNEIADMCRKTAEPVFLTKKWRRRSGCHGYRNLQSQRKNVEVKGGIACSRRGSDGR